MFLGPRRSLGYAPLSRIKKFSTSQNHLSPITLGKKGKGETREHIRECTLCPQMLL